MALSRPDRDDDGAGGGTGRAAAARTVKPDVTLLVCTRDRAASLAATLASISRAIDAAPDCTVEVVLVDNGSTDDTPRLLAEWHATQPFPVHLLHEARPGLARARNRGLAKASGRIVAMTDDDCVLHPDYVAALVRAFGEVAAPAIIGGRILLGDPADLPVTVKLEDHPMVAAPGAFPGGFVMGANLAFTADVPALVGRFDERFGAGAPFVAAEDTDFLFRAQGLGIALRYDPRFVVDHHHGRRDPAEETALLAGYGFGDGALYAKHRRDPRILRAILRDLADLRRDLTDPVTTHTGIRAFYTFRLRHKIRGMLGYWRHRARRPKGWLVRF
ncbi:glycosyltransferase [Sphingomonas sp. RP10(2022)]|uniref:Glycosyltransferase n=1 Tax=Sphingomonas liriopis TaxID=2949094 RepID=A0A9X2KRL5_9SPHN|nr:glycosyltransferase [Sphingomonas liriopis]MCP3736150.1 glycosyltransferase [Sphingomonas liriopis]